MAHSRPWRDMTEDLPVELLADIFERLPQPSVLSAAGVSRRWRSVATALQNYYRHHTCIVVDLSVYNPHFGDLRALERVVREAETERYNLSLRIDVGANGAAHEGIDTADVNRVLAPCLHRAAPRLVALSLSVSQAINLDILSAPAYPLLRRLSLAVKGSLAPIGVPLPVIMHMLDGGAPRLHSVSLQNFSFRDAARGAFPSVDTLTVAVANQDEQTSLLAVHRSFPRVRHLAIERLPRIQPYRPAEFDIFRGLESLVMGESACPRQLGAAFLLLDAITSLEFRHPDSTDPFAYFALPAPGPLTLVLEEHVRSDRGATDSAAGRVSQLRASLLFAAPAYRRTIDCDTSHDNTMQMLASLGLAHRLTQLTIDDRHVRALMRTLGALPALRVLSVILIKWATVPDSWDTPAWERALACHCGQDSCACSGPRGYFADGVDDDVPGRGVGGAPLYPALHTLRLGATRRHSCLPTDTLRALSSAFAPGAQVHLELCNGLELAVHLAFVRTLFASVSVDHPAYLGEFPAFDPRAAAVGRAAALRKRGAERKEALRDSNGGFTVFRYYDFDV